MKHTLGSDSKEEIDEALKEIIKDAIDNGISEEGSRKLKSMIHEFRDCFRINLGNDPPAKVRPLKVELKPGARPIKCPQRRYSPAQKVFIGNTIKNLDIVGAVFKNPNAKWASPALAVPKPGTDDLRFTVDLRRVNDRTEPIQASMPHNDSTIQQCEGSKVYAEIDFPHGFWQLPLDGESREIMSIQTPFGVYSPYRVLQGGTDSANYFQQVTSEAFDGRVKRMLQWIDDFLLHAPTEEELLKDIETFFEVCREYGFKMHAKKSRFFM